MNVTRPQARRTLGRLAIVVAVIAGAGCRETSAPPNNVEARQAAPQAATDLPPPPPEEPARQNRPEPPAAPPEFHTAEPSAACLARTGDEKAPRSASIHRWVDSAGVTHYSDTAPDQPVSAHRVLEIHGLPPVNVEASGYDANLPRDLQQRAIVDAMAVQHVFHEVLGIDGPAESDLKIVFVRAPDAYAELVGDRALAASAGAYVSAKRTIYVRLQGDDEFAFSVLRHEITHALIHERVGDLPVSLNEGLAEYFRRYHAAGMGGQVDIAADRASLIGAAPAGDGTEALVELLALVGQDFYAADRERLYLRAYALVALLMRDTAGTAALHAVLARQQSDPCRPVSVEAVLDAHYPGRLAALAADWAAFLRDPPVSVRAY